MACGQKWTSVESGRGQRWTLMDVDRRVGLAGVDQGEWTWTSVDGVNMADNVVQAHSRPSPLAPRP